MNKAFSFAEYLQTHETLTYSNVGVSMLPLLRQGRDLFTVRRKGPERCKAGDVVLYPRNRQYVLHRMVEVRPDDYVIPGGNCASKEYGVSEWGCQLYTWVWLHTIGPRLFLKRRRIALSRCIKGGTA